MTFLDLFLAFIANTAWGFNFIAGKVGAVHFQPLFFTAIRFCFLLLILLPWLRPVQGQMPALIRVGFVLGVLHFGMVFIGLHAGGDIASIAIAAQLYVPFSAILAVLWLKERIAAARKIGILLAFCGVLVIGFDPVVFNHLDALAWIVSAAFAFAVATIMMKQCPDLGVFRLQAWIALIAAPSLMVLSLIFEENHLRILAGSRLPDFWSPLYSAVGASIMGHGIVYYLLGRYSISLVSPLLLLAPVIGIGFGVWLMGDALSVKIIIGALLTLSGVFIVNMRTSVPAAILKRIRRLSRAKSELRNL